MSLNDYSKILYVSSTGSDDTGDGSKRNPYATVDYAVSKVDITNTLISINKGVYNITSLANLAKKNYSISYQGKGLDTTLILSKCGEHFADSISLYDFIIKPSNTFTGDVRALNYSSDVKIVNYYNCLFQKSDNGKYPTACYFFNCSSGTSNMNKNYYNCTFGNNLAVCMAGLATLYNCATIHSTFGTVNVAVNDSITNVVLNEKYQIENTELNKNYGIYSGEYLWGQTLVIIKQNNKFYSIFEEFYSNGTYTNCSLDDINNNYDNYAFPVGDLLREITIDGETFRPVDKFGQFQLISKDQVVYNISGLKSNKELIISNQNLSTSSADIIHNFLFEVTKEANSDCKFVISSDDGKTWVAWNGNIWETLINTCPLDNKGKIKQYSNLSDSEKNQWNRLKEEVYTKGMSSNITNIDYNTILTNSTIRFAFVLYRPTYKDNIALKNTQWLYDKVGVWHKLSEADIDIAINTNSCVVTPKLQNLENVKINILI